MDNAKAVQARRILAALDTEMDRLEESGGHKERYSQLCRRQIAVEKLLYGLSSTSTIVMANVPIGYFNTAVVCGTRQAVQDAWDKGVAKYGRP